MKRLMPVTQSARMTSANLPTGVEVGAVISCHLTSRLAGEPSRRKPKENKQTKKTHMVVLFVCLLVCLFIEAAERQMSSEEW